MKPGKITQTVLNRSVFKNMKKRNEDTICKPRIGLDSNGFIGEDGMQVLTAVATMAGYEHYLPELTTFRAINNIYASGGEVKGITLSLMLPRFFEESMLKDYTKRLDKICAEHSIDIFGGSTTVNEKIQEPILTVNAIGTKQTSKEIIEVNKSRAFKNKEDNEIQDKSIFNIDIQDKSFLNIEIQDKSILNKDIQDKSKEKTILLTKHIGMEGTIRMASEKQEELQSRFTKAFVDNGRKLLSKMSLKEELNALKDCSNIYTHDVSEGGIFGALYELSEILRCGLDIDLRKIPMTQETIEYCEYFDINPYMLVSGGALLIVTEEPKDIIRRCQNHDIDVTIIGSLTQANDKVIRNEDEVRYLEPYKGDEIYKVFHT